MFRSVLFPVLLLLPIAGLAGTASGRVTSIYSANDSPAVLFMLDGELQDSPHCNKSGRFAIDTSKTGGANVYRALLEAKARGYSVAATGLNTCAIEWKSEDLRNLEIR